MNFPHNNISMFWEFFIWFVWFKRTSTRPHCSSINSCLLILIEFILVYTCKLACGLMLKWKYFLLKISINEWNGSGYLNHSNQFTMFSSIWFNLVRSQLSLFIIQTYNTHVRGVCPCGSIAMALMFWFYYFFDFCFCWHSIPNTSHNWNVCLTNSCGGEISCVSFCVYDLPLDENVDNSYWLHRVVNWMRVFC